MTRNRSEYLKRFYGRLSSQFDAIMNAMYGGRDIQWRELAVAELPEDGRILEVGAGTGRTAAVQNRTEDYVSMDISRRMLSSSVSIDAPLQGDVHRLPFETNAFDGVIGVLLLSTQIDQQRAVEEVARVTKPGGRIVFLDKFRSDSGVGRQLDRILNVVTYPVGFDFTVDIEAIGDRQSLSLRKRKPVPNNMNMIELLVFEP